MILVNGMLTADDDARTLVDLLLRVGRADDVSAAIAIDHALAQHAINVELSPADCAAVLDVLDDPTDGLARLQWKLARDHRDRI